MSAERPAKQWPAWIDDILAYGPIAELETEWKAAVADSIVRTLDLRNGSREIVCACCGATKLSPEART